MNRRLQSTEIVGVLQGDAAYAGSDQLYSGSNGTQVGEELTSDEILRYGFVGIIQALHLITDSLERMRKEGVPAWVTIEEDQR